MTNLPPDDGPTAIEDAPAGQKSPGDALHAERASAGDRPRGTERDRAASLVGLRTGPAARVECRLPARLDDVWNALVDPEDSAAWLAEVGLGPAVGAAIRLIWPDGDCAAGRVIEWDPPRRLSYTWHWQCIGPETMVQWTLEPDGDGTRLSLEHSGMDVAESEDYQTGWEFYLGRLSDLCEGRAVPPPPLGAPPSSIEMAIELPEPRERVWRALTDEDEVGRWFSRAHIEPRAGGSVQFFGTRTGRYLDGGTISEWDPPRRLAFTWSEPGWPSATEVMITLADAGRGTRVGLQHTGWEHLPQPLAREERRGKVGWRDALAHLRAYLAHAAERAPSDGFRHAGSLPVAAEEAWQHLVSPESIRRWITQPDRGEPTVRIEPVRGGEVRIEMPEGDAWIGRITRIDAPREMTWAFRTGGIGPEWTVALELTPETSGEALGSRLVLTGRGLELETERQDLERLAAVWMIQMRGLASGEDLTRIEPAAPAPIELTVDLLAPPTYVFAALTRPDDLLSWLCERAEFTPAMGAEFTFERASEAGTDVETGRVFEFRPGERLAYTWKRLGEGWGVALPVSFDLRPIAAGTRLRFRIDGWDALPLPLRDAARASAARAWRQRLGRLREVMPARPMVAAVERDRDDVDERQERRPPRETPLRPARRPRETPVRPERRPRETPHRGAGGRSDMGGSGETRQRPAFAATPRGVKSRTAPGRGAAERSASASRQRSGPSSQRAGAVSSARAAAGTRTRGKAPRKGARSPGGRKRRG